MLRHRPGRLRTPLYVTVPLPNAPPCACTGYPESAQTKEPSAEVSAFLTAKGIKLTNRCRSFPWNAFQRILKTLPDVFFQFKNEKGKQLFTSLVVERSESEEVATFEVPGETVSVLGSGQASLTIYR